MKPDKAIFQTMKTASHEKFGKDQTIGMPYKLLLHRDFRDKEALVGAIERGVVHQWVENGVPFAGYRQTSAGISKTVSDTHSLGGKSMDVTKETSQAIAKAFSSVAFVFGDTEEAPKESSSRDLVVHPGSSSSSSKECEFLACLSQSFLSMFFGGFLYLYFCFYCEIMLFFWPQLKSIEGHRADEEFGVRSQGGPGATIQLCHEDAHEMHSRPGQAELQALCHAAQGLDPEERPLPDMGGAP